MSNTQKDLARAYLSAMFASDGARLGPLMTDDCKVWMPRTAANPPANMPIPLVGRDSAVAVLTGFGSKVFKPETVKWTEMLALAENDHVAIQFRLQGQTQIGNDYDNTYVFIFRIAGGKIAEVWEATDTSHAQRVFFATGRL
jgi:ketosteroid isomerase-like protein